MGHVKASVTTWNSQCWKFPPCGGHEQASQLECALYHSAVVAHQDFWHHQEL